MVDLKITETIPQDEGTHLSGEESFEQYGESLPQSSRSFLDDASASPPSNVQNGEAESLANGTEDSAPRRIKMSKKMKKSMEKFKKRASELPLMFFHNRAKEHPEWELDTEEKDLLTESIDVVLDVLDIEIAIEPVSMTLTSIWWVMAYPVLAFMFVFFTKQATIQEKIQREMVDPNA